MDKPKQCAMPDLSNLDVPQLSNALLNIVLGGRPPQSRKVSAYTTNFIRVVDQAILEYRQARDELLRYVNKEGFSHYFLAVSHLEMCIIAARRSQRYGERLKREEEGPTIKRAVARCLQSLEKNILKVRDAIEHMDEKIQKGEVPEGEPISLMISENGDKIRISNVELTFSHLSEYLIKLHEICVDVARMDWARVD